MSRFGRIKATRVAGTGSNYFTNGLHLARVDRIKFFEDGKNVPRCAIEFTVIKTLTEGDNGEFHKPGTEASKLWEEKGMWFLSQFKQFVKVVLDLNDEEAEEQIDDEVCDNISDETTQPAAGELITVFGKPHKTNAGTLITATSFKDHIAPHEALALTGHDIEAFKAAYRDADGFKSLADFNARAAVSAKAAGIKWSPIE